MSRFEQWRIRESGERDPTPDEPSSATRPAPLLSRLPLLLWVDDLPVIDLFLSPPADAAYLRFSDAFRPTLA